VAVPLVSHLFSIHPAALIREIVERPERIALISNGLALLSQMLDRRAVLVLM